MQRYFKAIAKNTMQKISFARCMCRKMRAGNGLCPSVQTEATQVDKCGFHLSGEEPSDADLGQTRNQCGEVGGSVPLEGIAFIYGNAMMPILMWRVSQTGSFIFLWLSGLKITSYAANAGQSLGSGGKTVVHMLQICARLYKNLMFLVDSVSGCGEGAVILHDCRHRSAKGSAAVLIHWKGHMLPSPDPKRL